MSEYRGGRGRGGRGSYRNSYSYNDHDDRSVSYNSGGGGGGSSRGRFKSKNRVKRNVGSYKPRQVTDGSRGIDDEDINMDRNEQHTSSRQRHSPYGGYSRGGVSSRRPRGQSSSYYRGSRGRGSYSNNLRMAAMDSYQGNTLSRLGLPLNTRGGGDRNRESLQHSNSGWYKVNLPYGQDVDKSTLLSSLQGMSSAPFIPIKYSNIPPKGVMFYVNDKEAARGIKNCSRQITTPKGSKLVLSVLPTSEPETRMNTETLEKVKVAMSNRYDPTTKNLDLSNMYYNKELQNEGINLALRKQIFASEVVKIISEYIPELEQLNLSNNKLYNLGCFVELGKTAPNLTSLNLSRNELRNDYELDKLKCLSNITELYLDGNQVCDNYTENSKYISAIRKRFPKVVKLDGHDLPPPITFDTDASSTQLPTTQSSRFPNSEVQELVCRFLKQYYDLFDSANRQPLLDAYHDNVTFSLSCFFNPVLGNTKQSSYCYMQDSRNLLKLGQSYNRGERYTKTLKTTKLNVVAALQDLPETEHDPKSFMVDVSLANPQIVQFTVTGLFLEKVTGRTEPLRTFARTFATIPSGEGLAIVNEQFTITNATEEQARNAFKSTAPTPTPSPVTTSPSNGTALAGPSQVSSPGGISPDQHQLIVKFATQSGMNEKFSAMCLMECAWDYEKAAAAFTEANGKGAIPPEAFAKQPV